MKTIKLLVFIACIFSSVFTQEVTLYRVNVEGNNTTSDKMIKYSAGLRDGTKIQRADISTAITRLWDLGLFDDIDIVLNNESQYGVEITIKVSESPILNQVLFDGMTVREGRFKEKIELKSGQRIKLNSLEKASRKITEMYKEDGYFNVEVIPSIIAPQDTIVRVNFSKDVLFTVKENKKYKLKSITFEGNKNFSNRKLRKELTNTKQKKWWSFWVKNFNTKTFDEDKEALLSFYQNNGHRDFRVLSDTLLVDEESASLTLQINIDEGSKYYFRNFSFEGNQIAEENELRQRLSR
jgi:outer membrane protein insertion porin family